MLGNNVTKINVLQHEKYRELKAKTSYLTSPGINIPIFCLVGRKRFIFPMFLYIIIWTTNESHVSSAGAKRTVQWHNINFIE